MPFSKILGSSSGITHIFLISVNVAKCKADEFDVMFLGKAQYIFVFFHCRLSIHIIDIIIIQMFPDVNNQA